MSEDRKDGDLVLEYEDDALTSVMALPGLVDLSLAGQRLFDLDPASLLRLIEVQNGAPGRYRSTGAAFDNLAISVADFCELTPDGDLIFYTEANEAFAERAIEARRTAYLSEERDSYRTLTVLSEELS